MAGAVKPFDTSSPKVLGSIARRGDVKGHLPIDLRRRRKRAGLPLPQRDDHTRRRDHLGLGGRGIGSDRASAFSAGASDRRSGTAFQEAVWRELRRIPLGETRSYADIAKAVGQPDAVRAVGTANGSNPVAVLVPCHRVIRSDGSLGGYAGGLDRKRKLLSAEGADPLLI
ncbi:MGMT family protein [Sphingomonas daechungensis]|uniref:MGMT family protein n=1 Tax=Sphingomonas daechungensis TaxID=1176646 RepID=A0ABX6T318_9SPHN|nr:MGMT family protein [Sphingomonas daechungensis]